MKARRLAWALAYRLALMPLILAVAWVLILFNLMYPTRVSPSTLPEQFMLTYEDVKFTTADGVGLEGWYLNSMKPSEFTTGDAWKKLRPAVVVCHGYASARDHMLYPMGTELVAAGYDVLLFDFRGHGSSGEAPSSFGVTEAADVVAAVEFLHRKPGVDPERIGIFGTGMGGYAAILAAPRCKGVRCVVADSTYPSVRTMFRRNAQVVHAPAVVGTAVGWGLSLFFGGRFLDDTATDAAATFADRGLLLVTGAEDRRSPAGDLRTVLSGAGSSGSCMTVASVGHSQTLSDPATVKVIIQYFASYLGQSAPKPPAWEDE